jgi:V/A-type H+-transporting ATPase subunit C
MDFGYVNTRVCVMRGQLLSRSDILDLTGLRTHQMVIDRLLAGPYQDDLSEALTAMPVPLLAMDRALDTNLSHVLDQIVQWAGSEGGQQIWALVENWDIQCLKAILRGIHRQMMPADIWPMLGPAARLHHDALKQLIELPDIRAVVDQLLSWSLPWGEALRPHLRLYNNNKDLRPMESALDSQRFLAIDQFAGGSRRYSVLSQILLMEAEMTGIMAALNFPNPDDQPEFLPVVARRSPTLRSLMATSDFNEILDILARSHYRAVLDKALPFMTEPGRLAMFERLLDKELLNSTRVLSLRDPLSVALPCHYLRCKRNEIMNIKLIAHGIEKHIPENAVMAALVFPGLN